jgi:hypothetical protein
MREVLQTNRLYFAVWTIVSLGFAGLSYFTSGWVSVGLSVLNWIVTAWLGYYAFMNVIRPVTLR